MSTAQAQQLAHELTIEYIKANPCYLQDAKDNIPKIVDDVADINKCFYDAIIFHKVLNSLY